MSWDTDYKTGVLRSLFQEWQNCTDCLLHETRFKTVFGNGSPDAKIMFVGQSPASSEDETGDAFCGESGILLNSLIKEAGMERKDVFVTNLVMCRPPEGRCPTSDERKTCWSRLRKQIYTVDPLLVIPVGKIAMEGLMGGAWKSISKLHGEFGFVEVEGELEGVVLYDAMPIYDPGFIAREDHINRRTMNWETGGLAHQTVNDLARALERVQWLAEEYAKPVRVRTPKPEKRSRLRIVS